MHSEKLRATVSELEQELLALETVDNETRRVLQEAIGTIRATLRENDRAAKVDDVAPAGDQSLTERLSAAVTQFEGQHPTLTGILGRLIDGLAQMGI